MTRRIERLTSTRFLRPTCAHRPDLCRVTLSAGLPLSAALAIARRQLRVLEEKSSTKRDGQCYRMVSRKSSYVRCAPNDVGSGAPVGSWPRRKGSGTCSWSCCCWPSLWWARSVSWSGKMSRPYDSMSAHLWMAPWPAGLPFDSAAVVLSLRPRSGWGRHMPALTIREPHAAGSRCPTGYNPGIETGRRPGKLAWPVRARARASIDGGRMP